MGSPSNYMNQPIGNAEPNARTRKTNLKSFFSFHVKKPNAIRTKDDLDLLIYQKTEEIENLKRQVNEQVGEIHSLKKRIEELEEEVRVLKRSLDSLEGDHKYILIIGEVCRRLQANLYQSVFPGKKINPNFSYKMAKFDEYIENTESEEEKSKAKKNWEDLKQEEELVRFQDLINKLQKLRNTCAHPEVKEFDLQDVTKAAEELNKKGSFHFPECTDSRFDDVKELIKIWYRTEQKVKKE